ncbi:hypothetical protein HMPREF1981_02449 [Bacteroides pyogenes F0041]|uniref:Uncharacterized protein n=1 Tax=Bacteroides pyogenes F0041 TaxID=1321819 RepID=U2CHX8_9BACE|nr:hypothetical protein HMPREF1981_02449 [Bacteroides pyogenes F0041]
MASLQVISFTVFMRIRVLVFTKVQYKIIRKDFFVLSLHDFKIKGRIT